MDVIQVVLVAVALLVMLWAAYRIGHSHGQITEILEGMDKRQQ